MKREETRRRPSGGTAGRLCLVAVVCLAAWLACGYFQAPARADAPRVGSRELIEQSEEYDGREVVYTGEVVGEILDRGEYSWITVNDDPYATGSLREHRALEGPNTGLGVFCRSEMLAEVKLTGSYRCRGDLLRVEGTFYQANPDHGGDLMIEADSVTVVREGEKTDKTAFGARPAAAGSLGVAVLILAVLWYSLRRREEEE